MLYVAQLALLSYRQSLQIYAQHTLNYDSLKFDAIVTEPPSAPTRTDSAIVRKFRADESEIEKTRWKSFPYFVNGFWNKVYMMNLWTLDDQPMDIGIQQCKTPCNAVPVKVYMKSKHCFKLTYWRVSENVSQFAVLAKTPESPPWRFPPLLWWPFDKGRLSLICR